MTTITHPGLSAGVFAFAPRKAVQRFKCLPPPSTYRAHARTNYPMLSIHRRDLAAEQGGNVAHPKIRSDRAERQPFWTLLDLRRVSAVPRKVRDSNLETR